MNPHKLYLSAFVVLCVLLVITGSAWREHVRDDAHRDAILDAQKSDIAGLERRVAEARSEAQAEIAELERQRQAITVSPERAPEIIRELVPMQSPIQTTSPPIAQSPPDAPSATLNKQQEVDLAQFALTCRECSIQRDQLETQVKDQQEIVSRQKIEIDAAKKAAKGGSVWQRTVRISKWGAIFGAVGYVIGRAQR